MSERGVHFFRTFSTLEYKVYMETFNYTKGKKLSVKFHIFVLVIKRMSSNMPYLHYEDIPSEILESLKSPANAMDMVYNVYRRVFYSYPYEVQWDDSYDTSTLDPAHNSGVTYGELLAAKELVAKDLNLTLRQYLKKELEDSKDDPFTVPKKDDPSAILNYDDIPAGVLWHLSEPANFFDLIENVYRRVFYSYPFDVQRGLCAPEPNHNSGVTYGELLNAKQHVANYYGLTMDEFLEKESEFLKGSRKFVPGKSYLEDKPKNTYKSELQNDHIPIPPCPFPCS